MNNQEKQLLPCPECGGQRYWAQNTLIGQSFDLPCHVVICSGCGYTTFSVSNPMDLIERIEDSRRSNLERLQRRSAEAAQREAKRKKGFLRW